jgi:hypothetical protein
MELTTLGELPVGATFVRHDEWGDGHTLYVKLANHGYTSDTASCHCGTLSGGSTGPIVSEIQVQEIKIGKHLEVLAFCLASSVQDLRTER